MNASSQSFLQIAARAMSWMLVQHVGIRVITFFGQLVLGWLLMPSDFGLYALALSITNAIGALRNGGIAPLLSRHASDFDSLAARLSAFALIFNIAAALLTIALAPLAANHFKSDQLGWLLVWIAVSFPAGTWAVVFRSRLAVDGRYRELGILGISSTLFWQACCIGMALSHFGAYSYVVPTALQGVVEALVGYSFVKHWPRISGPVDFTTMKEVFHDTRWVILGAGTLSLATTGDYFAVGLFTNLQTLGQYFFAFQLLVAVANTLTGGIETALPPLLSRFNDNLERQADALLDLLRALMLVSLPLTGLVSVVAAPAVHILWHGKWDSTNSALPILAFCLPAWVMVSITRALLESRGLWRARLFMLGPYGVGAVLSAAYGARGDLAHLAAAVTCFYVAFAATLVIALARLLDRSLLQLARTMWTPLCVNLVCLGASHALVLLLKIPSARTEMTTVIIFMILTLLSQVTVLRHLWRKTRTSWTSFVPPQRNITPVVSHAISAD